MKGDGSMTRDELITALESASEGDWKLDLEIMRHAFPDMEFRIEPAIPAILWGPRLMMRTKSEAEKHVRLIDYTTSLDAAVTLIPENVSYELTFSAAGDGALRRARLWDWRRGPLMIDPHNEWVSEGHRPLPLAVCIAALRRIPELTAAMIKVPCPDCHGGSQYCCEGDQCQPEP